MFVDSVDDVISVNTKLFSISRVTSGEGGFLNSSGLALVGDVVALVIATVGRVGIVLLVFGCGETLGLDVFVSACFSDDTFCPAVPSSTSR